MRAVGRFVLRHSRFIVVSMAKRKRSVYIGTQNLGDWAKKRVRGSKNKENVSIELLYCNSLLIGHTVTIVVGSVLGLFRDLKGSVIPLVGF